MLQALGELSTALYWDLLSVKRLVVLRRGGKELTDEIAEMNPASVAVYTALCSESTQTLASTAPPPQ